MNLNLYRKSSIILGALLLMAITAKAQYATREFSSAEQAYTDSIKNVKYDYVFPILGQKAYQSGFDVPYSAGVMINTMNMKQHILITDFQLGFHGVNGAGFDLQDADFIKFGENTSVASTTTIRPDLWVLPFLNVYGLFGYGHSSTDISVSHLSFAQYSQIPELPINMVANVKQNIAINGFGVMFAGGFGPLFFTVDANWTWSKPELLENALRTQIIGMRVGHVFKNKRKPEKNFGVWVGGMRGTMGGALSHGSIPLNTLIPASMADKRDQLVEEYHSWYDGLKPIQQGLVNHTALPEFVDKLENWNAGGVIEYQFDKRLKAAWNGIIGCQYQFNKRWMIRSEGGVVGDRKSFMLSLNYRFCV
ncbi:MAG: hypothetical protein ACK5JS_03680 [Mangrovibacterium sp.]